MDNEIKKIVNLIETHKQNAYRKINEELVSMYFEIGKYLSSRIKTEKWGSKIITKIAESLKDMYPGIKGFDRSSLYLMIQFYETYSENEIVGPLARQISWTSNAIILKRTKSIEEKEFYIRLCIANNYSKRELDRQITSGYYQRYLLSNDTRIEKDTIKGPVFLDCYSLEFLDLPQSFSEKDLGKAILKNLKTFILEIGKDFTFVGEEYRIHIGNRDYYIDLLFYNRAYSCLVAFELKLGEFEPEYLSKMNFYLEALDRNVKKKDENPSVGIILCSDKDEAVVEYTLSRNTSPTVVATYQTRLIDKKILENKIIQLRAALEKKDD